MNEDLLEWEGLNGMRSLSHLLTYFGAGDVPVCVVGSFDDAIGTPPSAGAEVLAAAVAERLAGDDFRLIAWYPRDGKHPFVEVTLIRVEPRTTPYGQFAIRDGGRRELPDVLSESTRCSPGLPTPTGGATAKTTSRNCWANKPFASPAPSPGSTATTRQNACSAASAGAIDQLL